jgi:hypothetical protein
VIIIDGELKELNISFGQFGFPLDPSIANLTTMVYANNITKNGHSIYWEHACLADAQFQALYHVKEFLGHTEYERPIGHRMVMHYYYTLLCFLPDPFDILPNDTGRYPDGLGFLSATIVEPENLRAYEEFNDLPLSYLQDIALNRLAEVYKVLMSQEKIFVQGKEYRANFCGDGYIGENEYQFLEVVKKIICRNATQNSDMRKLVMADPEAQPTFDFITKGIRTLTLQKLILLLHKMWRAIQKNAKSLVRKEEVRDRCLERYDIVRHWKLFQGI